MVTDTNDVHRSLMDLKQISRARVVLSQVLACAALFLVLTSIGMSISLVTIVLPSVLNAKEGISLNKYQASWFGSLAYLTQPLGSLFSGSLTDHFGRKKALALVNIPHLIAWLLFTFSWDIPSLFVANALLGIGTGLMEAPSVTYVAEISDPTLRGILTMISTTFVSIGAFGTFLLGTVLPWRTATSCFLALPTLTCLVVFFVPETPVWLLSRERTKEALKSLCWVRGWCPTENVQQEFQDLVNYEQMKSQCMMSSQKSMDSNYAHTNLPFVKKYTQNFKDTFLVKETLRPFILVLVYFAVTNLSGIGPLRPNLINISKAFGMKLDSEVVLVLVSVLLILGNICATFLIKLLGKRRLALLAMLAIVLSSAGLALYALLNLRKVYSYDPGSFPTEKSWIPTVLFFMMVVGFSLALPWIIISEIFPFKSRGTATGIAAAGCYMVAFISTKSYLDIENYFEISGAFFVNSAFAFIGLIYLYALLPETENKTLQEIEEHFSGDDQIVDSYLKRILLGKQNTKTSPVYEKVLLRTSFKDDPLS